MRKIIRKKFWIFAFAYYICTVLPLIKTTKVENNFRKHRVMKHIDIPHGTKKKLVEKFQTSSPTVWAALNYITKSDFAKQIRAEAVRMGGVIKSDDPASESFIPNCQTIHEKEGGKMVRMVQVFANEVKMVVHVQASIIEIYHKKELVATCHDARINDWTEFAYKAQQLSETLNEE